MTENRSLGSGASYPQRGADAQNPPVSSAVAPLCGALRTARPTLPIWLDWVPLVVLPIAGVSVRGVLPAWVLMWVVAFAIYLSCKWLTWRRATRKSTKARPWRSVGYFLLWPGMDADSFVSPAPKEHSANWIRPGALTMAGVAFLWLAARESLTTQARESLTTQSLWIGWLGMVGLILVLHFGIFELLA